MVRSWNPATWQVILRDRAVHRLAIDPDRLIPQQDLFGNTVFDHVAVDTNLAAADSTLADHETLFEDSQHVCVTAIGRDGPSHR